MLFWVNWRRHTTNSALHRETRKPYVVQLQFYTPWDNILKLLFTEIPLLEMKFILGLISWCRSSSLFKIQAREQRHRFLLWHAGLFTRSDLDRNLCAYNLRTCIRIQTFWDNLSYIQVIIFQSFDKLPAPLEINSQITATCLAHTLFFKVTTHHRIFGGVSSCRSAGCSRLLKYMQHVCHRALYCHKE